MNFQLVGVYGRKARKKQAGRRKQADYSYLTKVRRNVRLLCNSTVFQVRDPSVLNELLNRTTHAHVRRIPPAFAARRQYVIVFDDKARAIIGVNQHWKWRTTWHRFPAERPRWIAPGSHGEARGSPLTGRYASTLRSVSSSLRNALELARVSAS